MELTVVGCSGSVSGPDSAASCYLLQGPYQGRRFSLVLDLGPGAFGALYRYLDPADVDAIGLSHLHPDHCLDVCGFHVASRHSPTAPWSPVPLYGPAHTLARLDRAYAPDGEPGADAGLAASFQVRRWAADQQIGPWRVSTLRVAHPVEAYALRLTGPDGATVVYTGDTGPLRELAAFARGADLLLAEAAFVEAPDLPAGMHLTGRQAAELAAAAGVGRLVLTHIPPWHDSARVLAEARPHFAGPLVLARPGARYVVAAGLDERSAEPFVPRTRRLGIRVDVSDVADALHHLEGPDAS